MNESNYRVSAKKDSERTFYRYATTKQFVRKIYSALLLPKQSNSSTLDLHAYMYIFRF